MNDKSLLNGKCMLANSALSIFSDIKNTKVYIAEMTFKSLSH